MLLCVSVPSYQLAIALRGRAGLHHDAVLLADKLERGHVMDATPAAKRSGAKIGMTLVQAQSVADDVSILVHDPLQCAQQWEDVLDLLDRVSPLIDNAQEGVAFVHMAGIAGGYESWIARAREALSGIDLPFRLSVASNKFTARAAAQIADGTICPQGGERALLAPLGIETLQLPAPTLERLQLLGIHTLQQLAALPHGPFVRRFGSQAARWHRYAQGLDSTPFLPRPHQLHIEARLYGEGNAETEEQVYFALRVLINRVQTDLSHLGKRAGALRLSLELEDGDRRELEIRIAQPTADPAMLFDLSRAKLEGLVFASPICGLQLQAVQLEDGGVPATLFAGSDPDAAVVELALARLETALGQSAMRAQLLPANRVEAQFSYDRFVGMPPPLPAGVSALPAPEPMPQLRLLNVREIDVRVLKSAPAFVGSPPQAVLDYAGPWRVDETWFERPISRDEYDVLLEDGALYRIFRQGERWYLRGAYD